ncbi:MAG: hypothetical protein ACW9XH_07345 [Candidatus Nitrosopumilus sp. bin_32a]
MPKNRRGLSSVVGALFFTVLMIAGFSVLSLALDAQTDIVTTQRAVSDIDIKKQQEHFGILVSTDENNFLSINVDNQGQNPVEISSIWIMNKTLPDQPVSRYTVNYDDAFIPSGFTSNILSTQTLEMIPDAYGIKVISTLGSIQTDNFVVGGSPSTNGLRAELITDPPDVIIGQNVTIAMIVTNTGDGVIQNVEPDPLSVSGTGSVIAFTSHRPVSVDLDRGESVMFSWDYRVTGDSGDDLNFSAIARGDFVDPDDVWTNVVSDTSILRLPTDGGETTTELIVLTQDLLARPEIFVILPVPFGESNQQALWGVNVVNPIEKDLEVSKIVITATSTRYTGGDEIFTDNNGNACSAQHVDPTMGGTWSCPIANQLMWKDLDNPITVPGLSTVPFLARVEPGFIGSSGTFLETVPVSVTVYTTLGQFGKSGYGTSFHDGDAAIPNVYLTDVPGSIANANIFSNATVSSGGVLKLNATLADFDADISQYIKGTDSRLIINIPKGWTNPSIISAPGFTMDPIASFGDGSSQIVGTLNSDITGASDAQTIQFQITAPDVTSTQLYVMYILADGVSTTGGVEEAAVGSLAEVVLKVLSPP